MKIKPGRKPAQTVAIKEKGKYVPGIGPSNAKIAFCGEAPGGDEEREGKPFVGRAGSKLRELCSEAGLSLDECYVTNVVKYRPPLNDFKRLDEIGVDLQESTNLLFKELRELSPNIVIALGDKALTALTGKKGITKYRGALFTALYGDFKVLPTIHPSSILRGENPYAKEDEKGIKSQKFIAAEIVVCDLMKAKKESLSKKFLVPQRKLEIITSAHQLQQFLNSYSSKEPSIDIESYKCIPTCIAIAFTPWHSVSIPLMPIAGSKGELRLTLSEYIAIWKVLSRFLNREDIKLIGQNIKYDLEKLIAPAKLIHPYKLAGKVAADTSIMMGFRYPELPRSLEFSTSILTNEPFYKDEGKEFNPKKDPYETLMIYNAKDAAVTLEVKKALDKEMEETKRSAFVSTAKNDTYTLKDFYYEYGNKLTELYMDIEAEGMDLDIPRLQELRAEYSSKAEEVHKETVKLLDGLEFNVRSHTKDIPHIVYNVLKLPRRENLQENTIVALIGNHTEPNSLQANILRNILYERQILQNNNYLDADYDADKRMRSSWNPVGTETGRSSTSVLGPPLRPFKNKPDKIGLAFQTLPKHGPFSEKIRSIFIPPPGYVFLEADYSQAEARIVSLLSDDHTTLELFNTSDIHSLTSSWLFNISPESVTPDQRFIGKKVRHAGNYGMRKNKLMLEVNSDAFKFGIPVQISEQQAGEILEVFHRRTPKIRKVFQNEVRNIVHNTRTLWNPYGRVRQFFGYLKDEEAFAQIPQSTVPDSVRFAALRIRKRAPFIRICAELHDALLFKIPENDVERCRQLITEEMEVPIDFKYCSIPRGLLRIPVEVKIGTRFSELKKVA